MPAEPEGENPGAQSCLPARSGDPGGARRYPREENDEGEPYDGRVDLQHGSHPPEGKEEKAHGHDPRRNEIGGGLAAVPVGIVADKVREAARVGPEAKHE